MAAFRRVLMAPGVRGAATASVIARIPIGLGAVGLVLYVHQQTGSFGVAGATAGAMTICAGLTGPPQARLVDRRGPRFVLVPSAAFGAVFMAAVVVLGRAGAGPVALAAAAGLAGVGIPPLSGVLRERWPELVSAEDLPTAYAFDSILIEAIFISGPLLAGLFAATIGPGDGLLAGAALGLFGTIWFAALPMSQGEGHPEAGRRGTPKPLSSPTMRLLIIDSAPIGATFGVLDVALPAFGVAHGSSALGGPFAAALAVGSAAGGIAYGLRPHRLGHPIRAFFVLSVVQVFTCLPMLLATSIPEMLLFAALGGVCVAPLFTVRNRLAHATMPAGTGTEAFTWMTLSVTIGASAGSAMAGPLVQAAGWRAGVALAAAIPALGLLQLLAGGARFPEARQEA